MKRNGKLRFACYLCDRLGIDDPVYWLQNVPPAVYDLWLAYHLVKEKDDSGMKAPSDVFDTLFEKYG